MGLSCGANIDGVDVKGLESKPDESHIHKCLLGLELLLLDERQVWNIS